MTDDVGVNVTRGGAVLRLELARPDKRNAVSDEMMATLIGEIDRAGRDESVRVIVISGAGDHFCSGADFVARNENATTRPRAGSIQRRLPSMANRLIPLIVNTQTPVVVRAHGWTAGLGLNIAVAADFCVAADDARLWAPFTGKGFTPDSGATWLLPRRIGEVRAREMVLLGREVNGREAVEWGLVHSAAPVAELDDAVEEVVDRMASGATVALGLTKWLLHSGWSQTLEQHLRDEAFGMELSSRSDDFREGYAAFREKRDPDYRGR
ncbi:MAG TPA: enoyl-CoA hydratase-related protein [Microthrixaceae bacterium]|nr:enoyl-CoA hydratase-related protein [Microthrixaceae bacterium]